MRSTRDREGEVARGLLVALALLGAGCSHVTAYVRPDAPATEVDAVADLRARVVFVGDAGRPHPGVLEAVRTWSAQSPKRTVVVYLGDNVYEHGLPAGPADREKAVLDQQVAAVSSREGLFIPGNHDWRAGRKGMVRQQAYVERSAGMRLLPPDGCPGPSVDTALDGLAIVALDTQWLLSQPADAAGCGLDEDPVAQVQERLRGLARRLDDGLGDRLVIVVAHHPPWTYGPHGGFYDWRDHLFPLTRLAPWAWIPLPVVGSLYPLARVLRRHEQDAFSGPYRHVQKALADAFADYAGERPLIFAGGHDHSLQVLVDRKPWDYVLVSGSGSSGKLTSVSHGADTAYAQLAHGFMVLDLMGDGAMFLRVVVAGQSDPVFTRWLRDAAN